MYKWTETFIKYVYFYEMKTQGCIISFLKKVVCRTSTIVFFGDPTVCRQMIVHTWSHIFDHTYLFLSCMPSLRLRDFAHPVLPTANLDLLCLHESDHTYKFSKVQAIICVVNTQPWLFDFPPQQTTAVAVSWIYQTYNA